MTLPLVRRLVLGAALSACALGAQAQRSAAMDTLLLSEDLSRPIVLLSERVARGADIQVLPHAATGTPKDLPRRSQPVLLKPFTHDAAQGPVTLVVDYAGTLSRPSDDAEAIVEVGIECPEASTPCSYPIAQSVLGFRSAFMAKEEVITATGPRTVAVGREAHTYTLPPGVKVEMRLTLLEPKNIEPLELKARLLYGKHDRRALPGQTTRGGLLWKVLGSGLLLAVGGLWWLRRR